GQSRGGSRQPSQKELRQRPRVARDGALFRRRRARAHGGGAARRREAGIEGEGMGLFSSLFWGGKKTAEEPEAEPAPESIEELAAALDSPDGGLRVDGSRILLDRWRNGDAAAAEALAPRLPGLLEDAEPMVRIAALNGVRMMRKPENLERNAGGV